MATLIDLKIQLMKNMVAMQFRFQTNHTMYQILRCGSQLLKEATYNGNIFFDIRSVHINIINLGMLQFS